MIMKKNSFVFFFSWRDALSECSEEVRLEVYESVIEYAQSGTLPKLKPMAQMAFNFIKVEIDRNNEKYDEIVEKRRAAGKVSRANANKCQQMQQMLTNATDDVYVYDDVDVDVSLSMKETACADKERENFLEFLLFERHLIRPRQELERFLAYYDKTNWLTSTGQKVTNRLAALKSWRCEGPVFAELTINRLQIWKKIIELFPDVDKILLLADFRGFNLEDNKLIIYVGESLHKAIKLAITDEIKEKVKSIVGVEARWRAAKN
jgi:hypothetical protein